MQSLISKNDKNLNKILNDYFDFRLYQSKFNDIYFKSELLLNNSITTFNMLNNISNEKIIEILRNIYYLNNEYEKLIELLKNDLYDISNYANYIYLKMK